MQKQSYSAHELLQKDRHKSNVRQIKILTSELEALKNEKARYISNISKIMAYYGKSIIL